VSEYILILLGVTFLLTSLAGYFILKSLLNNQSNRFDLSLRGFDVSLRDLHVAQASQMNSQINRMQFEMGDSIESKNAVLRQDIQGSVGQTTQQLVAQMEALALQMRAQMQSSETKNLQIQSMISDRLDRIQNSNDQKLEQMRATVEEKLQGTLEKRIGESFKMVSERLEQVQRGLGEMQTLATGVGDLKRVLTNVKTRGTWGEAQLQMILDQIFTPDQYEKNSKLGRRTSEVVEFAIKIPSKENESEFLYLPIDSKFPHESFARIQAAQDLADPDALMKAQKELELALLKSARDVRDKYINPPLTTDFAVMYLPSESLYAESLRIVGLIERMQSECRVTMAGPTTVSALLSSVQMGLRSIAIQKRSGEVWKVLATVKAEFGKFGDLLDNVQKSLIAASNKIDDVTKKSRTIESKLRNVQLIDPVAQSSGLLPSDVLLSDNLSSDTLRYDGRVMLEDEGF
jgi:DNA recombination protein RmuC